MSSNIVSNAQPVTYKVKKNNACSWKKDFYPMANLNPINSNNNYNSRVSLELCHWASLSKARESFSGDPVSHYPRQHRADPQAGTQPGIPGSLPGNCKRNLLRTLVLWQMRGFRLHLVIRNCVKASQNLVRLWKENDWGPVGVFWNGCNFIQLISVTKSEQLVVSGNCNPYILQNPGSWE